MLVKKILLSVLAMISMPALFACAPVYYSGPRASQTQDQQAQTSYTLNFPIQQTDRMYSINIENNTPLALGDLPATEKALYNSGLDRARRRGGGDGSDIHIEIRFFLKKLEDPEQRIGNTIAGALFGAAMGAAIGAIAGDAGRGAAIGAAGGGISGLASPAVQFIVEAHVAITGGKDYRSCHQLINFNVTATNPANAHVLVDNELANIFNRTFRY